MTKFACSEAIAGMAGLFEALIEACEDAVLAMDLEGVLTAWNDAAQRLFGYTADEAIGSHVGMLVPPDRREELQGIMGRLQSGERIAAFETVRITRDGTPRAVAVSISPIKDSSGEVVGISAILRDITQRRRLEEQLRQSQKMEAVGTLAGGIAHDFNNLLTAINGYSDLALRALPTDHPVHEMVREIKAAGERASSLTRQLLAFGRRQVLVPTALDLNVLVADMERMLRRILGEDVDLHVHLGCGLGQVVADTGQLEQVLLNLAVNARDAMPAGGRLTIETRNVYLGQAYARSHAEVTPGPYVLLAVSNTGCGMSQEVLRHVFEPFFTTKPPGKGTGLGLATVHGIVKRSGGHVWVHTEPGMGTTFKVYLPRVSRPAQRTRSYHGADEAPRGSETVLLVEDDPAVRGLACRALEASGYRVLAASRGAEALRLAEDCAGPIHLLLTDVVMPGMSGRELAEVMTRLRPGLPVLFLSGYTDDAVVRHGVLSHDVAFLQKPFEPAALAHKVREVLDAHQPHHVGR